MVRCTASAARSGAAGLQKDALSTQDPPLFIAALRPCSLAPFGSSQEGISAVREEGRIRHSSHVGETASPSSLIKFPQPLRLSGASRQTALQAGGGESPAPSLHLRCKGSCAAGQEGFQLPAPLAGLQLPCLEALPQLGVPGGRMLGFS